MADLHAERVRSWPSDRLLANIEQRRRLAAKINPERHIAPGDFVVDFDIPSVDGDEVRLSRLLKAGPVVIVFFRFANCPACNIALPYYQEALAPGLKRLGAQLLALSPQIPERLKDIKQRHSLDFLVASDIGNRIGRRFGVTFEPDDDGKGKSVPYGKPSIAAITGADSEELPMPTVVVIAQNQCAVLVDVSPDWLVRTEAETILDAVSALTGTPTVP